jgi:CRP/FNR family transcriptional regulator, anaerobic regulatory protein
MDVTQKVDHFFSQFPLVHFKKGELIISPDQPITSLYFLKEGSVRMYSLSEDGSEITLHLFRQTSYFPLMLSLSKIENRYYFECVEDVDAVKAPVEKVMEFLKKDHEVLMDVAIRFAQAICGLTKRIEDLAHENAPTKIAHLLLYFANKFGETHQNGVQITLLLTHEDIAHWTGLSRETTSRQLEKMQQQGIIAIHDKKFFIPDLAEFKTILSIM